MADLLRDGPDLAAHVWRFRLWPKMWQLYTGGTTPVWETAPLETKARTKIPRDPGVYTLLVQPGVAEHPANSYLMYVGKAKSLRVRFGDYLTKERFGPSRPLVVKMLRSYEGRVWFCYTRTKLEEIADLEQQLYDTFMPPCNSRFSADVGAIVKAFGA